MIGGKAMGSDEHRTPDEEFVRSLRGVLQGLRVEPIFAPPRGSEGSEKAEERAAEEMLRRIREFNLKPREVRDYLDQYVISQDEAKKVLAVAVCDHYNHVRRCLENPELRESEYTKQNVLLMGPTGVGKTYLMRCIARLIGVPQGGCHQVFGDRVCGLRCGGSGAGSGEDGWWQRGVGAVRDHLSG